jgi:lipoprotein-anchoring transpeptidase ErfK/SrfK
VLAVVGLLGVSPAQAAAIHRPNGTVRAAAPAPNPCARNTVAHLVVVHLRSQSAVFCQGRALADRSLVTTGAVRIGRGTPTGVFHVYAKERNRVLHPSTGGAYPVKYWMPYHGAYGIHDASWQTFPYGSPLYTTQGSHGCVHLPAATMAWFYAWAPVGTTVDIVPV